MNGPPEHLKAALAAQVPFPQRLGKPQEYASLALEMCRNSYLNGETVRLDGVIHEKPFVKWCAHPGNQEEIKMQTRLFFKTAALIAACIAGSAQADRTGGTAPSSRGSSGMAA